MVVVDTIKVPNGVSPGGLLLATAYDWVHFAAVKAQRTLVLALGGYHATPALLRPAKQVYFLDSGILI